MSKVTVVGAGAWGTALALQACRAGGLVELVARNAARAGEVLQERRSQRLEGVVLPQAIAVRADIDPATELLVWAVPMQQLRASLVHFQPPRCPLVVCAKGVELNTGLLPLEVVNDTLGGVEAGVLSGPNFASEVARGLPAASVVGATDAGVRQRIEAALSSPGFRLYGNRDVVGVQLGGAAKNVVAIAAGAVVGAGLGENARAALVTRGLSEIGRLVVAQGGCAETVMGLSGLGDLLLTCSSTLSRNFTLGLALGRGDSLQAVLANRSTTEGVATADSLVARAGAVELPICTAVAQLLSGAKTLEQVVADLLSRPQRDE